MLTTFSGNLNRVNENFSKLYQHEKFEFMDYNLCGFFFPLSKEMKIISPIDKQTFQIHN